MQGRIKLDKSYTSKNEGILYGAKKNIINEQSLIELFEEQVRKKPDTIAVKYKERELSYSQLSLMISRISKYISTINKTNSRIGIFVENSIEIIAAICSVLKVGSTYVPMDIENGAYRNKEIISDSNPDFILISKKTIEKIKLDLEWESVNELLISQRKIIVVEDAIDYYSDITDNFITDDCGTSFAYIMYTSGSTGKPKGVMVSRSNLMNYLLWAKEQYISSIKYNHTINFALFTSFTFDLTITSLFLPLITGNTIILYDSKNSGYVLGQIIRDNLVDVIKLTPSHLRIVEGLKISDSRLKTLIVGGELLQTSLANQINDMFLSKVMIYNEYGPTEVTVGCMIHKYNLIKDKEYAVPIGIPINNTNIYILSPNGLPVKTNEIGELFIAGDSVTNGYLNRQDITKNSFLDDISGYYNTMYKTNDLAYIQDDGTVMFVGRSDQQIKLNGYRIELEEIEANIVVIPGVKDAVVVLKKENDIDYICAYVVCETISVLPMIETSLSGKLPSYMLPKKYLCISDIPHTTNGKIDRKILTSLSV